jgi:hypothetical protein
MIDWFFALDKAAQAALASAVVGSIVVGAIAVLGFWLTFKTSTAANREIAEITKSSKTEELNLERQIKVSEFKERRIQDFRDAIAEYVSLIRQIPDETETAELRKVRLRIDLLAVKIRLMLDMTKNENEELLRIMSEQYDFAFNLTSAERVAKNKEGTEDHYATVIAMSHDIMIRDWNELILILNNQTRTKESN